MESNPHALPSIPALAIALLLLPAATACASPAAAPPPAVAATDGATARSVTVTPAAADWKRVLPRPELPADRPLTVAFLLTEGIDGSELVAPLDVFHHLGSWHDGVAIETFTVSADGRPVTTVAGLEVAADHGFADAPAVDVLVVPGVGPGAESEPTDPRLLDWVRRTGSAARWVVSLRDGAFLLARAGLLDGRAATTFPASYDRFAAHFPGVDLRVNVSFVHDGPALTSQGGARSFDVALYLVDHLFGEDVARRVAIDLLLDWPPDHEMQPRFVVVPRTPAHP